VLGFCRNGNCGGWTCRLDDPRSELRCEGVALKLAKMATTARSFALLYIDSTSCVELAGAKSYMAAKHAGFLRLRILG
jgi:hypothetical protein